MTPGRATANKDPSVRLKDDNQGIRMKKRREEIKRRDKGLQSETQK